MRGCTRVGSLFHMRVVACLLYGLMLVFAPVLGDGGSVRGAFLGTLYLCSYLGLPVVGADTPFSLRDGFFPDRGLHVSSLWSRLLSTCGPECPDC